MNTLNVDVFGENPDLSYSKQIGIAISVVNILFVTPFIYAIVWYERYGSNQNRTLINLFVISACWVAIINNIFLQIPEVIILFGFPLGQIFCTYILIVRNAIIIHYAVLAAAISIVKYLYVFVYKNPTGRNDNFWCFFVNSVVFLLGVISQFIFQFLPGKNPYFYYICMQRHPEPELQAKINYTQVLSLLVCLLIYCYVVLKIKLFKSKIFPQTNGTLNICTLPATSCMGHQLVGDLSSFATLATSLLTLMPIITVAFILNGTNPEKLGTFPYLWMIQFHLHGCPFIVCMLLSASHFMSQKKLRDAIFREIKQFLTTSHNMSHVLT